MNHLGVAVIGFGWMGHVHTRAYLRLRHHYPDLAIEPRLVAVADAEPGRAEAAAAQYGFATATTDWRELLADPRVEAVSVTTPNFLHREIGAAVAATGRHLWIEKPVGLTGDDARAVAAAAAAAGVQGTVGFNYRSAPAVAEARALLAAGAIGQVTDARFRFASDYAADPAGGLSWRFTRSHGGAGVLGDLASHAVDLARHLLGEIDALVADTSTVIGLRPAVTGAASHFSRADGPPGPVENEDYLGVLLRFASGARGTLTASRVAVGEQNTYGFEIHGTRGALGWDFRRMGELAVSTGDSVQSRSYRTVFAGPGHGEFAAFQPGAGIPMSYDDTKVIEAAGFLRSIVEGKPHGATLADAVAAAAALDAMLDSVRAGAWVRTGSAA
ncbi:Gfo/Idh/MocA family oxidoreductase [Actinoplanes sp. NEAU-A12]|uniref:Gfo/Idh/MocA family oxidoreductase n=1 Tax=Actinoplanes sandaracinus TaxID=3045177 RepID=A0ABT6WWZ6_9ACTN|nr:Gfo/Idh/MocA family oxidoreductase [Actinoplanes sandaracinus]MDI6104224.1 Gfo/Idh/MocA family oxidoreductase [Actinoplanes sandaracinus]